MLKMFKWLFNEPKEEKQYKITYKVRSLVKMSYVKEDVTCVKGEEFIVADKERLNYLTGSNPDGFKYVELVQEIKEEI